MSHKALERTDMAIDPDSVECDRHERLADKFGDELRRITDGSTIDADFQLYDGKAVINGCVPFHCVAELGNCELRIEEAVQKSLAALPENVRRAARRQLAERSAG